MDLNDSYFDGADRESIEEAANYFSPRRREKYELLNAKGELTSENFRNLVKEHLEKRSIMHYLIERVYGLNDARKKMWN